MPSAQLRSVGQIQVLGERVVLPAAGIVNGAATPDARGAVEVEEAAGSVARGVLDDEVAVEEDRLRLSEDGELAIEVPPTHLHHSNPLVGEEWHRSPQEVGAGDEVRVEHGDELALREFEPEFQSSGLKPFAVVPVKVDDV